MADGVLRLSAPAAAYMAGYLPHAMCGSLDVIDAEVGAGLEPFVRRRAALAPCRELGVALRTLAVARAVDAGVLVEVRRLVDAFNRRSRRLFDSYYSDQHIPDAGHYSACRRQTALVVELVPQLLKGSRELHEWFAFGASFGAFVRFGHDSMASPDRDVDAHLAPVMTSLAPLLPPKRPPEPGEWQPTSREHAQPEEPSVDPIPELRELKAALEPGLATKEWGFGVSRGPSERYMLTSRIAYHLLSRLKGVPPAAPVLVMDANRLIFHGVWKQLNEIPRSAASALWVLAERAGTAVPRDVILSEGRIQGDATSLPAIVSRARAALSELSRKNREKGTRHDGLITGFRSGEKKHDGPYRLDIEPHLVRVVPPKPDWMS